MEFIFSRFCGADVAFCDKIYTVFCFIENETPPGHGREEIRAWSWEMVEGGDGTGYRRWNMRNCDRMSWTVVVNWCTLCVCDTLEGFHVWCWIDWIALDIHFSRHLYASPRRKSRALAWQIVAASVIKRTCSLINTMQCEDGYFLGWKKSHTLADRSRKPSMPEWLSVISSNYNSL